MAKADCRNAPDIRFDQAADVTIIASHYCCHAYQHTNGFQACGDLKVIACVIEPDLCSVIEMFQHAHVGVHTRWGAYCAHA